MDREQPAVTCMDCVRAAGPECAHAIGCVICSWPHPDLDAPPWFLEALAVQRLVPNSAATRCRCFKAREVKANG
jgi:hypothetical protein